MIVDTYWSSIFINSLTALNDGSYLGSITNLRFRFYSFKSCLIVSILTLMFPDVKLIWSASIILYTFNLFQNSSGCILISSIHVFPIFFIRLLDILSSFKATSFPLLIIEMILLEFT